MTENAKPRREGVAVMVCLLLAGLLLRLYFLHYRAFIAGDSLLYQDIAQNWLHAHVYGLSTDTLPRPTLIRLPGYPALLAACAWIFDRWMQADAGTLRSFLPVLWLQVFVDLATCWLVSRIARRMFGARAGLAALALACLCPFTANYTAVALTETCTLFCLALAFHTLVRWCDRPSVAKIGLMALALSASVMLRPDQGLLAVCVLPAVFACGAARTWQERLTPVVLCTLLVAVPFVPWTVRNWRTFHVVQPLAPKLANDPGERAATGFQQWFRTWGVDFSATEDAYWKYPEETVLLTDLPERAFDSPAERDRTAALLERAAITHRLNPQVEAGFRSLATERIHAHPLRYYAVLPVARLVNMLLHPRVEMLPVAERWWQFEAHPRQTLFAWAFGALNVAYLLAALAGVPAALRSNRVLALSMVGYVALRCALLLTIDNAEQRYTLEFFPILIVFGAGLFREQQRA